MDDPLETFLPLITIFEGAEVLPRCLYCLLRFKFVAASWNRVVQTDDVFKFDGIVGPALLLSKLFEDFAYEFTLFEKLLPDASG